MPAELQEFDAKEWAAPGEQPDEALWMSRWGDDGTYHRCQRRYGDALKAWFDAHPDASFIDWINTKRARRRPVNHAE